MIKTIVLNCFVFGNKVEKAVGNLLEIRRVAIERKGYVVSERYYVIRNIQNGHGSVQFRIKS